MSKVPDICIRNHECGSSPSHTDPKICTQSQHTAGRGHRYHLIPEQQVGKGPVILLALLLAHVVQSQCTGDEILKNYLFMKKKKKSDQLISFCPLFHSPARGSQLPGHRDVLPYSKAHSSALTSLLIFSSIHCPRVNCQ